MWKTSLTHKWSIVESRSFNVLLYCNDVTCRSRPYWKMVKTKPSWRRFSSISYWQLILKALTEAPLYLHQNHRRTVSTSKSTQDSFRIWKQAKQSHASSPKPWKQVMQEMHSQASSPRPFNQRISQEPPQCLHLTYFLSWRSALKWRSTWREDQHWSEDQLGVKISIESVPARRQSEIFHKSSQNQSTWGWAASWLIRHFIFHRGKEWNSTWFNARHSESPKSVDSSKSFTDLT